MKKEPETKLMWIKPKQMPKLEAGDKIKLYGNITTVTGLSVLWNCAFSDYEIILNTIGRGDPFKRTLDNIEILHHPDKSN